MADALKECARANPAAAPADMIVSCPMAQCAVKLKDACPSCAHFAGVVVVNPSEALTWQDRHRLLCRFRRVVQIQRLGEARASVPAIGSKIGAG